MLHKPPAVTATVAPLRKASPARFHSKTSAVAAAAAGAAPGGCSSSPATALPAMTSSPTGSTQLASGVAAGNRNAGKCAIV